MTTLKVNRPIEVEVGDYAFVVHPTDAGWRPYILLDDLWYEIDDPNDLHEVGVEDVQKSIDHDGFQIAFEGVK